MRWTSALSVEPSLDAAVGEASARAAAVLDAEPDLVAVFVSPHHAGGYARLPALLRARFGRAAIVGCSGGGIIGAGREVEHGPAVGLTAAILPDVEVLPFHLPPEGLSAVPDLARIWRDRSPCVVVLPDPFSCDAERLIRALDAAFPGGRTVGGLASGARGAGDAALFLGAEAHRTGSVGVALAGNVAMDTIVAQGCRPIGEPMFVTRADGNLLFELDLRRAADVLHDLFRAADPADQVLFRHSVFLGLVMDERRSEYRRGDFLVRNLLGLDPETGALAVGAPLRAGMVVQFHLRDAATSAQDLDALLGDYAARAAGAPPCGALLFSCLGRGARLYGAPDHDSRALRTHLGDVPVAGFFCNGEIGPVQNTTYLHGYTSAFGLFHARA
jgi:small ligand-binding sensory domain FIST